MITIRDIHVYGKFRYLWLKGVTGVNLKVHCAKCLLGEYDERVYPEMETARNLVLKPAPYYYLCGVAKPYRWGKNFHLAFREKEGAKLTFSENGILITIDNAERVTFSQADIDQKDPHAFQSQYCTCRNW